MSSVINPPGGYLKAARVIYLDMRFRALIAGVNTLEVPWSDKRFDEYHSPEEKESTQSWQFTWKNLRQKRNICSQIGAIPSQRILQEARFRMRSVVTGLRRVQRVHLGNGALSPARGLLVAVLEAVPVRVWMMTELIRT